FLKDEPARTGVSLISSVAFRMAR
ncbi:MAG: hypothetical protein QOH11_1496, partial [Solirubrobacteraceae bacterium]|nr:hypothetical protein [Solirubrobacteraceae bacterium]